MLTFLIFSVNKKTVSTTTIEQYNTEMANCRTIFVKKTKDYGTAWRILRPSSLTDQIYIKAQRIRTIEEKGTQKIAESRASEYIGIVNYGIMALIQLQLAADKRLELPFEEVSNLYDEYVTNIRELMLAKNHDYGDIWRLMRTSSLTDLILMKILRVKQIEDNEGKTLISEGLAANYNDMVNYAIFALIQLKDNK